MQAEFCPLSDADVITIHRVFIFRPDGSTLPGRHGLVKQGVVV